MTKLNEDILKLVRNSEGHLTAEQAFMLAKRKKINVSLASVYRILGKLADEGKITRIEMSHGKDIFDKTTSEHLHLVCSKCGRVKDVNTKDFKKILIRETKIKDIESFNLTISYICDDCKKMVEKAKTH